ncbi:MAG: 6-bladed beta-propeller [Candidatus Aminicenantes bacterium]|jgi:hypothetical protein
MRQKSSHVLFALAVCCVLVLSSSCSQEKTREKGAGWKGSVERVDGVIIIKNPLEPMYGDEAFILEEELTIGEAEGREEYMFQNIYTVAVNGRGDIYVMDTKAHHVKAFDKDGRYLRTIGRPGQGPGELYLPRSLVYTDRDEIVVGNISNISYFTSEGVYVKSIPLSAAQILSIDIDNAGNIFGYSIDREKMVYALKKYDPELNELLFYGSSPLPTEEYRRTGKRNAFFTLLRWDIINGDQVVTGYPEEGYVIKILDSSGSLIRKIEKDYTPIEITQKDFEEEIAGHPPEFKKDYYAPKYFPPFWTLRADDEGRIWVTTSERTADGERRIYDVFDVEGKYILKMALKASPRIFKNKKMYTIEEDEEGYQSVKRYSLTWRIEE